MIYFDNAATTYPKAPNISNEIQTALSKYSFNAGRGSYKESNDCSVLISDTREKITSLIGNRVSSNNVIFTHTITEALNNIIYGLNLEEGDTVYVSPFEHNAVLRQLYALNVDIHILPFNRKTYEPEYSKINDAFIINPPKAVILSQVSNVVGYELPYNSIFELAKIHRSNGAICILDAAQGFGIYHIDLSCIDIIAFEGHKSLYSVYGCGGYINLTNVELMPIRIGGTGSDSLNLSMPLTTPERFEAGSNNTFCLYLLNKAIDFVKDTNIKDIIKNNTEYLLDKLNDVDNIKIYNKADYIPKGIVSFTIDNIASEEVGDYLYKTNAIATRTGYHCAGYVHKFLGTDNNYCKGTVRVSLGAFNTKNEIDTFIDVLKEI